MAKEFARGPRPRLLACPHRTPANPRDADDDRQEKPKPKRLSTVATQPEAVPRLGTSPGVTPTGGVRCVGRSEGGRLSSLPWQLLSKEWPRLGRKLGVAPRDFADGGGARRKTGIPVRTPGGSIACTHYLEVIMAVAPETISPFASGLPCSGEHRTTLLPASQPGEVCSPDQESDGS